jgi:RNA:NAD 2'-phosphotransferase (TPT1/KptA family)
MILNSLDIRSSPTFYKNQKDLDTALTATVEILSSASSYLPKESDEFFPLSYIISTLKDKIPSLFYINRNHIIEFYFKDLVRKISFKKEDYIKYETNTPVQPSEILHIGKPTSTLYFSQSDLNAALISTVHLLRDNIASLNKNDEGYYQVDDVCNILKKRMPFLSYIDKNFIIELFFKDIQRKIIFKDSNLIKYKLKLYIKPPDILYFGTLTNLALKMKNKGIFSSTKKYVKLYSSKEGAENFAKKFASNRDDKISVLVVDSKQAYINGLKFSTYEDGEYIASEIKKEFIKEIL